MARSKTTLEQYEGTIMESVPEATDVIVEKCLKQLVYNVKETSEVFRFILRTVFHTVKCTDLSYAI